MLNFRVALPVVAPLVNPLLSTMMFFPATAVQETVVRNPLIPAHPDWASASETKVCSDGQNDDNLRVLDDDARRCELDSDSRRLSSEQG